MINEAVSNEALSNEAVSNEALSNEALSNVAVINEEFGNGMETEHASEAEPVAESIQAAEPAPESTAEAQDNAEVKTESDGPAITQTAQVGTLQSAVSEEPAAPSIIATPTVIATPSVIEETALETPETGHSNPPAQAARAQPDLTHPDLTNPDLTKIAAGSFGPTIFAGTPADAAKRFILARAGIKPAAEVHKGLANIALTWLPNKVKDVETHKDVLTEPDVPRLPTPFPPVGYDGPLVTVADWLAAIDACAQ